MSGAGFSTPTSGPLGSSFCRTTSGITVTRYSPTGSGVLSSKVPLAFNRASSPAPAGDRNETLPSATALPLNVTFPETSPTGLPPRQAARHSTAAGASSARATTTRREKEVFTELPSPQGAPKDAPGRGAPGPAPPAAGRYQGSDGY